MVFPDVYKRQVVGCIHNVHQHKLLEQAQKRKQIYDSITSFYRLGSGLEVVETLCRDDPEGVLVLLEIQQFSKIDERYGLIFGDIILEQFAGLLAKRFQEDGLNGGIYTVSYTHLLTLKLLGKAGTYYFGNWDYLEKELQNNWNDVAEESGLIDMYRGLYKLADIGETGSQLARMFALLPYQEIDRNFTVMLSLIHI